MKLCCMSFVGYLPNLSRHVGIPDAWTAPQPTAWVGLFICASGMVRGLKGGAVRRHWLCLSVVIIYLLGSYSLLVVEPYRDELMPNFSMSFGCFSTF